MLLRRNGSDTEGGCRQNRTGVRFVKICPHPGDIPDIITDVVGDNGRVPRVIFGDACLDFSNQVCADIRRLGINTAADAGEKCLR